MRLAHAGGVREAGLSVAHSSTAAADVGNQSLNLYDCRVSIMIHSRIAPATQAKLGSLHMLFERNSVAYSPTQANAVRIQILFTTDNRSG